MNFVDVLFMFLGALIVVVAGIVMIKFDKGKKKIIGWITNDGALIQGPQGPTGATGMRGPQGPQGAPGKDGMDFKPSGD